MMFYFNHCPKCGGTARIDAQTFIERAKKIHGNKYDYSSVIYNGAHSQLKINCPEHGIFIQKSYAHINNKQGCPRCGGTGRLTQKTFIERAKQIHGDKYDYSNVNYKNNKIYINITCRRHKAFKQKPNCHLNGRGCPHCSHHVSKGETEWLNSLNILECNRQIKIKQFRVDALVGNTVYEFNGDYWHGNPKIFGPEKINKVTKNTFGELYRRTLEKEQKLRNMGYTVVSMWESDWKIN